MHWTELARAQDGVISHVQLASAGLSPSAIGRLHRAGRIDRAAFGVYLAAGAPLTFRARLWVAVLATDGVLCRRTAGLLWGVLTDAEGAIDVVVPHRRRVVPPAGVALHRQVIPPPEIRDRSGLPVTARAWTVLDLMATQPFGAAARLADRAVQRGWIDEQACARRLRDQPKRPGNRQLRRLAARFGDGAAAESERVLHRLLRTAGMTGWRPNYEVWVDGELVGVLDVAFPARRIAIEIDGMAYHIDVDRFQRDRTRQNALVALGWTVLRFTWADLVDRPGYVIAALRRVAA